MFVVAGATGNTGSVVAEQLLAAGKKVRVLVRDAAKGEPWKAKGAEVFALASLDDSAALTKALTGATAAYLLSPPDMGAKDFIAERKKTVDSIAQAVDASGVGHVVFLSSIGAQHASGTGPILTVHYAEQRLAQTKAKSTFIRAGVFLENYAGVAAAAKAGKLPSFTPADLAVPTVTTRDIGLTAAKALLEGPPAEKIDVIELAGARELSARDVAKLFAAKVGHDVVVEEAPLAAVVPVLTGFGISENIAGLFRDMYEGIANGKVAWEGGKTRHIRGATDPAAVIGGLVNHEARAPEGRSGFVR